MAIMMLDHTRDFVHRDALSFDPTDVSRTFPMLFLTRWITHFCAPLFVFLAGTAVSFQAIRGRSKAQLSRFLITRGLWLVAIELFVLRPLVFFNFNYGELLFFLQVIWAIGCSMIVLAAVIHLPRPWVIGLSVAVIGLHNTLDGFRVTGFGASVWQVLHQQGPIFPFGASGPVVFVMYPLVPWIAVMSAGYAFGWIYQKPEADRRRTLLLLGGTLVLGFIVLRSVNGYGDPQSVDHTIWRNEDDPVVSCGPQVSAITLVSADDVRPRNTVSGFRRAGIDAAACRPHVHHLWPGAVVLLSAAVGHVRTASHSQLRG